MRVSARDHFKSMSFYAHIMWKVMRLFFNDERREIQYFSYKESMAAYHTAKIKEAIFCNPFFTEVIDIKSKAESVLSYQWYKGGPKLTVTPRGLLEFKRGIHCDDVYVDDALQDPENKMILTRIEKINNVMKTQILDMFQREIHIVGTAQTKQDFFFDTNFSHRFKNAFQPAVINYEDKKVLWEEWMPWDELMAKKIERGDKIFNQEYQCSPVYSEEAFVNPENYEACVNQDLKNYSILEWLDLKNKREQDKDWEDRDVAGGFDIGKKAHPSHFAVFERDHESKKWIQIHSKWMDGWDYTDQKNYLQEACSAFNLYILYYDNTRGEFESFDEVGELPDACEGINFTVKSKHSMATNLDKALAQKDIEFLSDQRQKGQILIMNNDLKAPETPEGHGDSFWSVCMALKDYEGAAIDVTVL